MKNLKAWAVAFVSVALIAVGTAVFDGCTTTGSVPTEIIAQSAAVDTGISQLQTQQAATVESLQSVTDTAQSINAEAKEIKNDKLSGLAATLVSQVKTASDSHKTEISQTSGIQTDYSTVKVSGGTAIAKQSAENIKQAQQIQSRTRCIIVLAVILFIHLLLDAAILLLKFYFHKI
jgi:Flp pilus assembly pilin Flp